MKNIVIVDIDGTIAETHPDRVAMAPTMANRNSTPHWDAFNLAAGMDTPITDTIEVIRALCHRKTIVLLTGRSAVCRDVTEQWLDSHGVTYDVLIMRDPADHRHASEVKEDELRSIGLEKILCCFEDNARVAAQMRALGLTVYQVRHYDAPKIHEE